MVNIVIHGEIYEDDEDGPVPAPEALIGALQNELSGFEFWVTGDHSFVFAAKEIEVET
jgi:hypothetical protein